MNTVKASPLLEIRAVSKSFGADVVLDDIDLTVGRGEVVAIIGPSGSGKSTLLRAINHLHPPTSGFVLLDDELIGFRRGNRVLHRLSPSELLRQRTRIGFVFQDFNLFPHLSAAENVMEAPISALHRSRDEAAAQAKELLGRVGLTDRADAYPRQLSGGQQQRVAIARALALDPELILFDEPTSALDPELVDEVLQVIIELARTGRTLLIVTHEISFARRVADTVVFMDGGRIIESGTPAAVLDNPDNRRTRDFLSRVV
ncbi:amino acid ABC transporter ATP-binding protein [Williamsia sterculiae]|uniref:Amino acid ABC transporter ATP-binding protein, PAAT family n=1 Tax=Williamsia sterculiae TaxID=1344003 RepID=A0A1N7CBU8_9NOCA|nr:amino acid ABC transporter ATP-binding protein [Williamsia sterculiae]SIR60874.1 amino acid ABC transporter ATP-binding protein, PAAT family [Williamsia sterculiae]